MQSRNFRIYVENQSGVTLVAVAIVAFFVALIALTTLALTQAQVRSIDDQTTTQMSKRTSETGLEQALFAMRTGRDETIPVEVEGLRDKSGQEITSMFLGIFPDDTERDTTDMPEFTGTVYDENPDRIYYTAFDRVRVSSSESPDFKTIRGDSTEALITFVDDSTLVKDYFEYDYRDTSDLSETFIASLGETRKTEKDIRTSLSAKSFKEENKYLERRVVQTQVFNENHPEPPYIESEHNPYKANIDRNWVVAYEADPANPNRTISGIDLVFEPEHIGLASDGHQLFFHAWNGSEFEPFFDSISGPIFVGTFRYETEAPFPTKAIRVNFVTDENPPPSEPGDISNYGFKVSGVKYYYDSDRIPALYETPHPYNYLETNEYYSEKPEFMQVVYSPYALPRDRVIPIEDPRDIPIILSGINEDGTGKYLDSVGGNEFQLMRIHFDNLFSLEEGDALEVYNLNNGSMIARYEGTEGAGAWTPYAFRTNPDFPLALGLRFMRDGSTDGSVENYGYKVDMLEYTDDTGRFQIIENPTQRTAHGANMGYNMGMAGWMQENIIFRPADPVEGGTVTNWKIVFSFDCDLLNIPDKQDRIILRPYSPFAPVDETQFFVAPNGYYMPYLDPLSTLYDPRYRPIEELKGYVLDMGTRPWLEIITEFDNDMAFVDDTTNYGWSISRIEVDFEDAIAIDPNPPRLRTSAITARGVQEQQASIHAVSYPAFGRDENNRGEWWITSKGKDQILIHFDLDNFRIQPGDEIRIFNESGSLIKILRPDDNGDIIVPDDYIIIEDDDETGPIDFDLTPNPPQELIDSHGWVIVPGESAHIVLYGNSQPNTGYMGFDINRVAFWSPDALVRNVLGDYTGEETMDYKRIESKPVDKFFEY